MSPGYVSAELRIQIRERANACCEYCGIPEQTSFAVHEIDHIIAQKHGGESTLDNLALSCVLCNKRKGSDIASIDPASGEITRLYHPRKDSWSDHFQLVQSRLEPKTATARATVSLLQLNQPDRVIERGLLIEAGIIDS